MNINTSRNKKLRRANFDVRGIRLGGNKIMRVRSESILTILPFLSILLDKPVWSKTVKPDVSVHKRGIRVGTALLGACAPHVEFADWGD
jgi:hypothetical protein